MDFLSSFFLGLFFVFLTFLLCLILVIGIKFTYFYVKLLFPKKQAEKSPPEKAENPENKPQRKRKTIRSIEINPDEVDRIYVKKIS